MHHLRPAAGLVALAMLALPHSAFAQTAAEKAAAEALFDEGKKLVEAGRFGEACAKLEESQRLDAGIGTLLYLGDCYERDGRVASAWATFREAAGAARVAGQADREQIARARVDKLEGTLHRLTVRVDAPSIEGLRVLYKPLAPREGQPPSVEVPRATWGVGLPLDPGQYVFEASAPGYQTWSGRAEVPSGPGSQTVVVPALEPGAEAPTPTPTPGPAPAVSPTEDPRPVEESPSDGTTQRWVGVGIGALGVVGLVIGGIFTGVALDKDNQADALCDDRVCFDAAGVELADDAVAAGNLATVGFVAGGALLATGAVVFFTAPNGEGTARGLFVRPSVAGGEAGLTLGGRF